MHRRSRLAPALLLVAALGCNRITGACDRAALASAATELQRDLAAWSPESGVVPHSSDRAAQAIWQGCPSLPRGLRLYLDSITEMAVPERIGYGDAKTQETRDELEALLPGHEAVHGGTVLDDRRTRAIEEDLCPGVMTIVEEHSKTKSYERAAFVFDRCRLAHRGFLNRDEVITSGEGLATLHGFALDDWLIRTGGVPPDVAHPLTRELIFSPGLGSWTPRPEQLLPFGVAPSEAPSQADVIIFATRERIIVNDKTVAGREPDGRFDRLRGYCFDEIIEGARWLQNYAPHMEIGVTIIGDRRLRGPLLVELVDVARAAEIKAIHALIVTQAGPLHLARVRLSPAVDARPSPCAVALVGDTTQVRCGDAEPLEVAGVDALKVAIDECASGENGAIRVSVGPESSYQRVIDAAIAARDAGSTVLLVPAP